MKVAFGVTSSPNSASISLPPMKVAVEVVVIVPLLKISLTVLPDNARDPKL